MRCNENIETHLYFQGGIIMKIKRNMLGFGNSKLLNLGYKLLPNGLIVAALGGLFIELGGAWYKAADEKSEESIEYAFNTVIENNTK